MQRNNEQKPINILKLLKNLPLPLRNEALSFAEDKDLIALRLCSKTTYGSLPLLSIRYAKIQWSLTQYANQYFQFELSLWKNIGKAVIAFPEMAYSEYRMSHSYTGFLSSIGYDAGIGSAFIAGSAVTLVAAPVAVIVYPVNGALSAFSFLKRAPRDIYNSISLRNSGLEAREPSKTRAKRRRVG